MESNKYGLIDLVIVAALFFVILMVSGGIFHSNGKTAGIELMEKTAISQNAGTYKDGKFKWNSEIQSENFLKDLEFFKRNENIFKPGDLPGPLPRFDTKAPF